MPVEKEMLIVTFGNIVDIGDRYFFLLQVMFNSKNTADFNSTP